MPYLGNTPADKYSSYSVQHFTTSATTSYTLDFPVANENEIELFINNVRQEPGSSYAYTASGTSLTLSAATSASDTMYCVFQGKSTQTVAPATGSVTNAMLAGSISPSKVSNLYPYRNLIINGDMSIAQRGTSTAGLQYNNDNNFPSCDRWKFYHFGSTSYTAAFTGSQDTSVPSGQGFNYSLKLACTTADTTVEADTTILWGYQFEGQMLQHLAYGTSNAKTMTLSFWVKSNLTGIFSIELYQYDANDSFSYEYTINSADTWEKKTITIPANTSNIITNDNTVGMQIRFNLVVGSNLQGGTLPTGWQTRVSADISPNMTNNIGSSTSNYINFTGVQLEVGTTASDFEFIPYDVNLNRCLRYYVKNSAWKYLIGAFGDGPSYYNVNHINYPIPMRTAPTRTYYDQNGNSGQISVRITGGTTVTTTGISSGTNNQYGFSPFFWNATGTDNVEATAYSIMMGYDADAEL